MKKIGLGKHGSKRKRQKRIPSAFDEDTQLNMARNICSSANDAVLRWMEKNMSTFSCGQSLMLLTLVSDVLYKALHASASRTPVTSGEQSHNAAPDSFFHIMDPAYIQNFIPHLHDVCLELLRHIQQQERSKLDAQSLPLIASGTYAVFRLQLQLERMLFQQPANAGESAAEPEETTVKGVSLLMCRNMHAALDPHLALLREVFAMSMHLGSACAPSIPSTLQTKMSKDHVLGLQVILTFFLCVGAPARSALLQHKEASMMRSIAMLLSRHVVPTLNGSRESNAQSVPAAGRFVHAKDRSLSSQSSALNALTTPSDELNSDVTSILRAAEADETSPSSRIELLHSHDYLEECFIISKNMLNVPKKMRLSVLEYILFQCRSLEEYSNTELGYFPFLFRWQGAHSLHRSKMAEAVMELCLTRAALLPPSSRDSGSSISNSFTCPVSSPTLTVIRLLPFVFQVCRWVERIALKEKSIQEQNELVSLLSVEEAGVILLVAAGGLPSTMKVALQRKILSHCAPGALNSAGQCGPVKTSVVMTPQVVQLLDSVFLQSTSRHSLSTWNAVMNAYAEPSIKTEEQGELAHEIQHLISVLDWERGVTRSRPDILDASQPLFIFAENVETTFISSSSHYCLFEAAAAGDYSCYFKHSLNTYVALTVYVRLYERGRQHSQGEKTAVPRITDKALVHVYLRSLLQPYATLHGNSESHHKELICILDLAVRVVPILSSESYRTKLIDRLIRFNFSGSEKGRCRSLFCFLVLLAPAALEYGVVNAEALEALRDQHSVSLHPVRAFPRRYWGSGASGLHKLGRRYTFAMLNATRYAMMAVMSGGANPSIGDGVREQLRKRVSLWLEDYFRELLFMDQRLQKVYGTSDVSLEATNETAEEDEECLEDPSVPEEGADEVSEEVKDISSAAEEKRVSYSDSPGEEEEQVLPPPDPVPEGSASVDASASSDVATSLSPLITMDEVESLLTAALYVGSPLPFAASTQLIQRPFQAGVFAVDETRIKESNEKQAEKVSANTTGAPPFSRLAVDPDVPTPVLLTPARFVYYVRASGRFHSQLPLSYLEYLLRTCDFSIFHLVLSTFILASTPASSDLHSLAKQPKTNKWGRQRVTTAAGMASRVLNEGPEGLNWVDRLWSMLTCAATLLRTRLETEKFAHWKDKRRSETVTNTIRVMLHQLDRLRPDTEEGSGPSETVSREDPVASGTSPSAGEGAAVNGAVEGGSRGRERDALRKLEECLLECCAFVVETYYVKLIALDFAGQLHRHLPQVGRAVLLQWFDTHSLEELGMSGGEMLQFVSAYPPSQATVEAALGKERVVEKIDFSDFLQYAKSLPMPIVSLIVEKHLPSLSFAWCSRLLSALASRQKEIPLSMLKGMFARVEALTLSASDSDRNLLLMVLHGYLAPSSSPHDDRALSEGSEAAQLCYDRVLQVERVVNIGTLKDFLRLMPSSLHRHIVPALSARVEQHVLPPMVDLQTMVLSDTHATPSVCMAPLLSLVQLARLLQSEHLLTSAVRHCIAQCVFDNMLQALAGGEEGHCSAASAPTTSAEVSASVDGSASPLPSPESPVEGENVSEAHGNPLVSASVSSHSPAATTAEMIPVMVELALLLSHGTKERVFPDNAPPSASFHEKEKPFRTQDGQAALLRIIQHYTDASDRLCILSALIDLTKTNGSRGSLDPSTRYNAPVAVVDYLVELLLHQAAELSPVKLVKLIQYVSKESRWHVLAAAQHSNEADGPPHPFHEALKVLIAQTDPHTRCVVLRAVATSPPLLEMYEPVLLRTALESMELLSVEDVELLLATLRSMKAPAHVEMLLDALGTRIQQLMDQCHHGTFVRLLQCHAQFQIGDSVLLESVLRMMEKQSGAQRGEELRLSANQIIYLLQSIVTLDLRAPEVLLTACFNRVEKLVETLTHHQVVQLARLAVEVEMSYSSSIHALVSALVENKKDYRTSEEEKKTIELLCDVYDVEAPYHWRMTTLRDRKKKARLAEAKFYLNQEQKQKVVPDWVDVDL